jgi:hypothetical protein
MSLQELIHYGFAVISYSQAAEVLGCDPRTVSAGVANKTLPSIQIGSRKVIPVGPLCEYLGVNWVGDLNGN